MILQFVEVFSIIALYFDYIFIVLDVKLIATLIKQIEREVLIKNLNVILILSMSPELKIALIYLLLTRKKMNKLTHSLNGNMMETNVNDKLSLIISIVNSALEEASKLINELKLDKPPVFIIQLKDLKKEINDFIDKPYIFNDVIEKIKKEKMLKGKELIAEVNNIIEEIKKIQSTSIAMRKNIEEGQQLLKGKSPYDSGILTQQINEKIREVNLLVVKEKVLNDKLGKIKIDKHLVIEIFEAEVVKKKINIKLNNDLLNKKMSQLDPKTNEKLLVLEKELLEKTYEINDLNKKIKIKSDEIIAYEKFFDEYRVELGKYKQLSSLYSAAILNFNSAAESKRKQTNNPLLRYLDLSHEQQFISNNVVDNQVVIDFNNNIQFFLNYIDRERKMVQKLQEKFEDSKKAEKLKIEQEFKKAEDIKIQGEQEKKNNY